MDKELLPVKIEVTAYSGYRANERPIYFLFNRSKKTIKRIMKRWAEPGKDFFQVLADDGDAYLLYWERDSDSWFLTRIYHDYSGV